jgi:hypothetical protein
MKERRTAEEWKGVASYHPLHAQTPPLPRTRAGCQLSMSTTGFIPSFSP